MATLSAFSILVFEDESGYLYKSGCSDHLHDEKPCKVSAEMVRVSPGKKENSFKPADILSLSLPSL